MFQRPCIAPSSSKTTKNRLKNRSQQSIEKTDLTYTLQRAGEQRTNVSDDNCYVFQRPFTRPCTFCIIPSSSFIPHQYQQINRKTGQYSQSRNNKRENIPDVWSPSGRRTTHKCLGSLWVQVFQRPFTRPYTVCIVPFARTQQCVITSDSVIVSAFETEGGRTKARAQ